VWWDFGDAVILATSYPIVSPAVRPKNGRDLRQAIPDRATRGQAPLRLRRDVPLEEKGEAKGEPKVALVNLSGTSLPFFSPRQKAARSLTYEVEDPPFSWRRETCPRMILSRMSRHAFRRDRGVLNIHIPTTSANSVFGDSALAPI
jgi:hypothetical protein